MDMHNPCPPDSIKAENRLISLQNMPLPIKLYQACRGRPQGTRENLKNARPLGAVPGYHRDRWHRGTDAEHSRDRCSLLPTAWKKTGRSVGPSRFW